MTLLVSEVILYMQSQSHGPGALVVFSGWSFLPSEGPAFFLSFIPLSTASDCALRLLSLFSVACFSDVGLLALKGSET